MAITYNNLYLDIRQQLHQAGIEAATLEMRMDTKSTTNKKLVPQRGWCRGWTRTFSTVRGSPAS